jgi:hypothetical protein
VSYIVKTISRFDHEIKRLCKKYASLKDEFRELVKELEDNPEKGVHLGNGIYKIRLSIASKGKGKRGGARVITYLKTEAGKIYLLTIYDKGERSTISDSEILQILEKGID